MKTILIAAMLLASTSPVCAQQPVPSDVSKIVVPELSGRVNVEDEKGFDKYYYFERDGTDFDTALADIRYCDGLARGLSSPYGNLQTPYPYNASLAGAVGGAIGTAVVMAIFGSAEARKSRRVNMRRCMHYKGYGRYGTNKDLWQQFNFEEGLSSVSDDKRQAFLKQQAKVASSRKPSQKELGL